MGIPAVPQRALPSAGASSSKLSACTSASVFCHTGHTSSTWLLHTEPDLLESAAAAEHAVDEVAPSPIILAPSPPPEAFGRMGSLACAKAEAEHWKRQAEEFGKNHFQYRYWDL